MTPRRVVMVAMPCAEVMEIGGTLDVFFAANLLLEEAGGYDPGYAIEVVSPVTTIRSWPGLSIRAERSYRGVRGPIDTLIITGTDTPDDALQDADLIAWLDAVTLPESGALAASDLAFETWAMFDQAFGDRLKAARWTDLKALAAEPPALETSEPALAAYAADMLDVLEAEDPSFDEADRAQVERVIAAVAAALGAASPARP